MTAYMYIVDRAPKLEGFPLTIYMCWQLTMALTRIIINHGAMPDGINGLAQVNVAAELYRVQKTFPAQTFFPAASQSAFFDVALSVSCTCKVMDGLSKAVPVDFF